VNKNIGNFYHQMGVMFDAGLPVTRSLETAAEGQKGRTKEAVSFLLDEVSSGSTVSAAMKKKRLFVPFDIALIEAAEESGNLAMTFKMLADWYELKGGIIRKLKYSLMMPVFVLHLAFILGPLPYYFRGFMSGADYIRDVCSKVFLLWVIFMTLYFVVKLTPKQGQVRKGFDAILLIIPLLGKALRDFAYGSYCKAFNMLYVSGIPITITADLASNMAGNTYIGGLFKKAAQCVHYGSPMYKGMPDSVPAEIRHMWMIGEESGQLDVSSEKLAKTYIDLAKFGFDKVVFWYPKIFYFGVMLYMIKLVLRNAGTAF